MRGSAPAVAVPPLQARAAHKQPVNQRVRRPQAARLWAPAHTPAARRPGCVCPAKRPLARVRASHLQLPRRAQQHRVHAVDRQVQQLVGGERLGVQEQAWGSGGEEQGCAQRA
jgi:hypothetical protein